MFKTGVRSFSVLLILSFIFLGGCASQQKVIQLVSEKLDLRYNFTSGQTLQYRTNSTLIQTMEVRGNEVTTEVEKEIVYSVVPTKQDADKSMLKFTINSGSMNISQPGGDMKVDMNEIIGKSFTMQANSFGKEFESTDIDSITYSIGPTKHSIAIDFQAVFPDLAGKPVTIDDSWTVIDTIKIKAATTDFEMVMIDKYTLKGVEQIEDRNCAKITCATSANLQSISTAQGMDFVTKVELKGNATIYFDYENGIFVKINSDASGSGSITAMGDEKIIIPLEQKMIVETIFVE
ncbi:MAG: hypothetical protein U9P73_09185 [Candidatus Cloacimonadota bacterium]|nr:hypothetical protein [Candidatus Cloacimonadota bacterium]